MTTAKREIVCITCPIGCGLTVTLEDGQVTRVEGNTCKKGVGYAASECIHPLRSLTTTVAVYGGQHPVVSVKTAEPVPKPLLLACMSVIKHVQLTAPVRIGDVIVKDILNTGVDIVATNEVLPR